MFGIGDKIHHVYIIDFGLSKLYWTQQHCQLKQKLSLTGTARYASVNAHKGFEQSRRDDLEAIGHMFFYFLRGALPWSGLDAKTQEEKYRKICEKKEMTPIGDLNTGFPKQFDDYLSYCRNLQFTEKPDYTMLWGLMQQCREGSWQDHSYQWFDGGSEEFQAGSAVALVPRIQYPQPDEKSKQQTSSKGCF